jgi:polar amino acid transport system ATP-binding protein
MIRLERVDKSFGSNRVLRSIDLDVARGEVLCLIGPSGSGKSTLLRCVAQLETVDSGLIYLEDELLGVEVRGTVVRRARPAVIRSQRQETGMVFQHFNLFAHMTVLENLIEAPMSVRSLPRAAAVEKARGLLARVGLADKESAYPSQLSGGQQQRVAIARALAMDPKVLLFDEPTSALDPELVGEVLAVLTDLAKSGITMIVATHEMGFARDVATNVAFLDGGVIVEHGPARSVMMSPANPRTKEFLSTVSSL